MNEIKILIYIYYCTFNKKCEQCNSDFATKMSSVS